jgi:pimeloyl-ACP methyl ester carboxylesterase
MIARLLRIADVLLLIGALLIAGALGAAGAPGWLAALLAIALFVGVHGVPLAIQFATGAITDRRPGARLSPLAALRLWWGETAISCAMFQVRMPFFSGFAEPAITRDPARPAVLLLHGYACNRAVWKPLLDGHALSGCNVATLNLEPVFGSIDDYADLVRDAVDRLRAASGAAQVVLVCHSMGGLAARAYLRRHGDDAVARVVTISTPHFGTVFGRLGHGTNTREMTPRSRFLASLANSESTARRRKFVCIGSCDDNLIVPRGNLFLPDAAHRRFERVGHLATIADPRVWQAVREAIGTAAVQRTSDSAT